jgi:hypothetical protein
MEVKRAQALAHGIALEHGWWSTEADSNIPSKIALMHSELSEALEEYRDGRMVLGYEYRSTDKTSGLGISMPVLARPQITELNFGAIAEATHESMLAAGYDAKPTGFGIELADAVIRIMDVCGWLGIELDEMLQIKMEYNRSRPMRHGGKAV